MQPTEPGWYWDPQGMPNLFRWWDGEGWTDHVSPIRNVGPPAEASGPAPSEDGRFHAGGLSCAALPEPWTWCPDYPHLDDAIGQQVVVGHTPRGNYIGCVFIGALPDEYLGDDLDAMGTAFSSAMLDTFYPAEKPHDPPSRRAACSTAMRRGASSSPSTSPTITSASLARPPSSCSSTSTAGRASSTPASLTFRTSRCRPPTS